ncbi:Peptide-N4-(N-acetyl-beta-glucosaminyl)asparagine amidase A - like 4 [Theobroma cacao]|nr:Peptide-N4-(N-acetyl-beta-glucosaminyl)asparagine amidase A - like 4 [Theobroma cacao]
MNHFEEKAEGSGVGSKADLILPFLRHLPLNDGLWYEIENATDIKVKEFEIPLNAYRAVLEVYLSFHENDKFWYGNPLNDYIAANNLTNLGGNGPFTEVVVNLDGEVVGVVWPFTVVYTGGINPLLWRPISDFKGLNGTFITNTTSIYAKKPGSDAKCKKALKRFLFYLYSDYLDQGNGTSFSVTNVTLGFGEKKFKDADARLPSSSLRNLKKGPSVMVVKDNLVVGGVGSTQQTYNYDSSKFATPGTKQLKLLHSV